MFADSLLRPMQSPLRRESFPLMLLRDHTNVGTSLQAPQPKRDHLEAAMLPYQHSKDAPMNRIRLPLFGSALVLAVLGLYQTVLAVAIAVDAVSGASGGRKTITISAIDVTQNTAAITYSETENNGSLRFYYSTAAIASASDTNRANVTKMSVTTRSRGTLRLANLNVGTKYYYRFQGYYPKGQNNYWASGSLTTQATTSVHLQASLGSTPQARSRDILGRTPGQGSGIGVDRTGPSISIQR